MKVTEVKLNRLDSLHTNTPPVGSDVAMFSCEFPENEGVLLEKELSENNVDDSKTYTKVVKDSVGRDIIEVYSTKNDSLISRERQELDYRIKEIFKPGTTIIQQIEKKDENGVLVELTKFHDSYPYKPKLMFEYGADNSVKSERHYRNNENNSTEKTVYYEPDGKTVCLYDEKSKITNMTEYRKDNSLKCYTERDPFTYRYNSTTYRVDGSVYETKEYENLSTGEIYSQNLYNRDGDVIGKKYWDNSESCFIKEFFRDSKLFTREKLDRSDKISERTLHNADGSKYFVVKYDEFGKVIDYQKFKNTDNPNHDKFAEKRLNGVLDAKITQGYTGICYFASTIKGLSLTTDGNSFLDEMYDYDYETETSKVEFKNVNKSYKYTKDEIIQAMGRLGTGDPDFTAIALAWEDYVQEAEARAVDGGNMLSIANTLLGKNAQSNVRFGGYATKMTNDDLDRFAEKLKTKNVVITVGTPIESVDTELTKEEKEKGLSNDHMYAVCKITKNKVKLYDPKIGKNITLTRQEFLDNVLVYELLDLNPVEK